MQRRVLTQGEDLWFTFSDQPMRFSLREFHLTTDLHCEEDQTITELQFKIMKKTYLWMLGKNDKFTVRMLYEIFKEKARSMPTLETLSLGTEIITEAVIMAGNLSSRIPRDRLQRYMNYRLPKMALGKTAYSILMRSVKSLSASSWTGGSYEVSGFALAINLWAMSSVNVLGKSLGKPCETSSSSDPLCLHWDSTRTPTITEVLELEMINNVTSPTPTFNTPNFDTRVSSPTQTFTSPKFDLLSQESHSGKGTNEVLMREVCEIHVFQPPMKIKKRLVQQDSQVNEDVEPPLQKKFKADTDNVPLRRSEIGQIPSIHTQPPFTGARKKHLIIHPFEPVDKKRKEKMREWKMSNKKNILKFLEEIDELYHEFLDDKKVAEKYWLGVVVNLEKRSITTFNCAAMKFTDASLVPYVNAYAMALPFMIRNFFKDVSMDTSKFSIKIVSEGFPQVLKIEDSGVYALKLIECHAMGIMDLTKLNCEVEVSLQEDGFKGSWFRAILEQNPTRVKGKKLRVCYKTLFNKDGVNPCKETIERCFIRPVPPECVNEGVIFKEGSVVDAYFNNGWWTGLIVVERLDGSFLVYFDDPPDIMRFIRSQLRPHADWIGSEWIKSKNKLLSQHMFRTGKLVEMTREISESEKDKIWVRTLVITEIQGGDRRNFLIKRCTISQNLSDEAEGKHSIAILQNQAISSSRSLCRVQSERLC
ncbi:unnamed protein product [Brassica oleracea var. botrytis]